MEQLFLKINIYSNIYLIAISIIVQLIIYPSFKKYSDSTPDFKIILFLV